MMENQQEVDFDRDTFQEKFDVWKERFGEGGLWKDNPVTPEETFVFTLDNGKELKVQKYKVEDIATPDYDYSDFWFLLAKEDEKIVGYTVVGLKKEIEGYIRVSGGDIAVSEKGRGIGGKLSTLRDNVLQNLANQGGDIDDVAEDENVEKIAKSKAKMEQRMANGEAVPEYQEEIKKMDEDRRRWLALFAEGGKAGYKWDTDKENLLRRYNKGENTPVLDCRVEKNTSDLRVEMGVIRDLPNTEVEEVANKKMMEEMVMKLKIFASLRTSETLTDVIGLIEKGEIEQARILCENQSTKLDEVPGLRFVLAKGLWKQDERTPWGRFGEGLLKQS